MLAYRHECNNYIYYIRNDVQWIYSKVAKSSPASIDKPEFMSFPDRVTAPLQLAPAKKLLCNMLLESISEYKDFTRNSIALTCVATSQKPNVYAYPLRLCISTLGSREVANGSACNIYYFQGRLW